MLKFVLINEGESNKKLSQMSIGRKVTNDTKEVSRSDLMKNRPDAAC